MRTREEIEKETPLLFTHVMEVMLDIRELIKTTNLNLIELRNKK